MVALELLVLFLASLGMINIIIHSPIAELFRKSVVWVFGKFGHAKMGAYLIQCGPCSGFWVGMVMLAVWLTGTVWFTLPFAISFLGLLGQNYWFPETE